MTTKPRSEHEKGEAPVAATGSNDGGGTGAVQVSMVEAAAVPADVPVEMELRIGAGVLYYPHVWEARNAAPGPWYAVVTAIGPARGGADNVQAGLVTLNIHMPEPMIVGNGGDPVVRMRNVPFSKQPTPGHWSWR